MEGFLSVKEATKSYAQGCKAKAATSIGKLFGKAMLAGMMIGMGAAASSVAAHSVANVGLARLTAAVVFPVGLMMVILLGAELFTGDCLMALGVAEKHISVADCIRVLVLVFLGNFAGALIFTALVYCSIWKGNTAIWQGIYIWHSLQYFSLRSCFDGNLRKRYQRKAACIFLCNHAVCNSRL